MQPPVTPASSAAGAPPPPPPPTTTCSTSCRFVLPPTRRHLLASSASSLLLAAAAAAAPRAASSKDDDAVTSYDPVTAAERAASASVSRRVGEAVRLLDLGRDLQARGEFPAALASFTAVATEYGDLSLSGYARVGRALVLYEVGDRDDAIAEMEDASVALRGYPEIHAALAAALYADKHAALLAENQFAIATLLDPHYTDLAYVRDTKHWPPSLVDSLRHFITLS
uniref:MalT-like TPR region domain-containing protein n=1 Tax=Oryza nivara TaxID=4536 RepID=A0A0E0J7L0_ORYNI